jgi:delta8-fatty-acid desaturase
MASKLSTSEATAKVESYPLMSRDDIEAMIADGRKIIIIDQQVLKVDPWVLYHPGGDKAILHMVGKDATDEVTAYEPSQSLPFSQAGTLHFRC